MRGNALTGFWYSMRRRFFEIFMIFAAPSLAVAQGKTATVNGVGLYYEIEGDGPALVLLHGWTLNLRMWDAQIPALRRDFRVIRYDRRGFGKSGGAEDPTWDAADLAALLDTLGVQSAHILGMSQGGRVALQLARDHPERVLSLVLHSTSAPDGFGLQWSGPDGPRFDDWTRLARERGIAEFRRVWASHPLMAVPAGKTAARTQVLALIDQYAGGRFLEPVAPSGPITAIRMEDLPRINIPALVVIGDQEVPFLQIMARAFAYALPDARLALVEGGGHMVNVIEPERYNSTLRDFLLERNRTRK